MFIYRSFKKKRFEKDTHNLIESTKEIFGKDTVYFDISVKFRSVAGLRAIPDGFVIDLKKNIWHIIEGEKE